MSRKLTLNDISDLRAYERERDQVRTVVLEMKRRRRVALGTFITVAFENRDTMRYQIQEMARVEKLMSDADIQIELDTYNPLIPEPLHLCATLFIELTSDEAMREWLGKLVGIETHLVFRLPDGSVVRSVPEAQHARQLTRVNVTTAVHYLEFAFTPEQAQHLRDGAVTLEIDHPNYLEQVELSTSTVEELLRDLSPDPV